MAPKYMDIAALQAALERQESTIALLQQRINQLETRMGVSQSGAMASGTAIDETAGGGQTAYRIDTKGEVPAFTIRRMVHDGYTYSDLAIEDLDLLQLLTDEIGYKYPGINFGHEKIYMQSPFPAIIHNWDKLQRAVTKGSYSRGNRQARKDLAQLLYQISICEELLNYFRTREAYTAAGVTTFETAWTLFVPGTLIVTYPFVDVPQLFRVAEAAVPWVRAPLNRSHIYTSAWCWDWDGKRMVKVKYSLKMRRFMGTRAINEMEYYPVHYHTKNPDLFEKIELRSKIFLSATLFCKPGARQRYTYDGHAYVRGRKTITANTVEEDEDDDKRDIGDTIEVKLTLIKGDIMCDAQSYSEWGNMDHVSVEVPVGELKDMFADLNFNDIQSYLHDKVKENMLLLPGRLLGYATRERVWGQFFVKLILPSSGKNPRIFRENLQLEHTYKDLIEALFASHLPMQDHQLEDVKIGQGGGSILLLHGPSGVGKTLTAEAIALATGIPLLAVSVAEIGLDASRAENNLGKLFSLATRWDALLLVNEADVLLETRKSTTDISRNTLTSVFLRALESYRGTIILTTNRVKISVDEAIISRISLAISYHHLTDNQTHAIFKHFFDQLDPEMIKGRGQIDEFIGSTGHHYGLNGRQIQNVVSLALALARQECRLGKGDGQLTEGHIRMLCKMTREFWERLNDRPLAQRYNDELEAFGGLVDMSHDESIAEHR
ncbi:hypothetical protein B7463_g10249, partial [Scytalidium lignicola]